MADNENGLKEQCLELFEHELKASELAQDIGENNDVEDIDGAMEDIVQQLINNADSVQRKFKIFKLVLNFGQAFGSKNMVVTGKEGMEKLSEEVS